MLDSLHCGGDGRCVKSLVRHLLLWGVALSCGNILGRDAVRVWVTTEDLRLRLAEQAPLTPGLSKPAGAAVITVDPSRTFQTMLGFGSSLEHSTCSNLFRLPADARERVIERLVDPERGIGMNLMRVCMGTPDFTGEPWYSYNDLPPGETDPELKHFSIAKDRAYILPCLKLALAKNPNLLFFASPWSPPAWMKTTGLLTGGSLKPEWHPAYAQYFVKFIQAYAAEGIPIHAVTVQNEPGLDRALEKDPKWFYPSCRWSAEQERDFIRDHLGPALRRAALAVKIWTFDHNYNVAATAHDHGIQYPLTVLRDLAAARFVDGVAFHGYVGDPTGMSHVHAEFPRVPIHFTEGSVWGIWGAGDLIGRLRNWAVSYNAWVTLLDERGGPNNGPFEAPYAMLSLHSDSGHIEERFEFLNYGHFMKFIRRGAVRVDSTPGTKEFNNVAFRNPDGSLVLVAANTAEQARDFFVQAGPVSFGNIIPAKAVMTCVWSGQ